MVFAKRKKGETFEAFLRRFNKKLLHSGLILQAKKVRYFDSFKSKNVRRASALVRKEAREEREYMRKTGRLKEEPVRRGRY